MQNSIGIENMVLKREVIAAILAAAALAAGSTSTRPSAKGRLGGYYFLSLSLVVPDSDCK